MVDLGMWQWACGVTCLVIAIYGRAPFHRFLVRCAQKEIAKFSPKADASGFGFSYREWAASVTPMPGDATRIFHRMRLAKLCDQDK